MSHHELEFEAECESCGSSGLFVGMAEHDGAAVVCHTCEGTGKHIIKVSYDDFEGRKPPEKPIERVFEVNPGIGIGKKLPKFDLDHFGGMPFADWNEGKPFPEHSEMRAFTCPAWWYQSADYKKKPDWKECTWGAFSSCKHFPTKVKCWLRFDKEQADK
jgi:hypothetical protein